MHGDRYVQACLQRFVHVSEHKCQVNKCELECVFVYVHESLCVSEYDERM